MPIISDGGQQVKFDKAANRVDFFVSGYKGSAWAYMDYGKTIRAMKNFLISLGEIKKEDLQK